VAYTLGTAAKATGRGKATIYRAIKSGRISATRHEDGSYTIDPAELHRVFPPVPIGTVLSPVSDGGVRQSETPPGTGEPPPLALRNAQLEAEISGLKELLHVHQQQAEKIAQMQRDQIDALRSDRDRWHEQAQRLAIAPPQRRAWWPWRRAG
jgi:excisionase family DNA binding protein